MARICPRGIRSIEIETPDLRRSADFYTRVWRLTEIATDSQSIYLRGTSSFHHIVAIHQSTGCAAIRRVVFDVAGPDELHALHARIAASLDTVDSVQALKWPGGGLGYGFRDAEERNFALVCAANDHAGDNVPAPDRPHKIAHVNFNTPDAPACSRFLTDVLGLQLIDQTPRLMFFHGDHTDHNCLVLANAKRPTINHVAFEMADLDSVMRGAGRMKDNGYPIEWGVGRHGAGDNVFAYFAGPDELPVEYTSEVLQIDESYVPRGPDFWTFPPGRADQWGVTNPPSARLARIQDAFEFTADGYRTNG